MTPSKVIGKHVVTAKDLEQVNEAADLLVDVIARAYIDGERPETLSVKQAFLSSTDGIVREELSHQFRRCGVEVFSYLTHESKEGRAKERFDAFMRISNVSLGQEIDGMKVGPRRRAMLAAIQMEYGFECHQCTVLFGRVMLRIFELWRDDPDVDFPDIDLEGL